MSGLRFVDRTPTPRWLCLATIACAALLAAARPAAAGGADQPNYPEDIARIKDRGTLLVAQFQGARPGFFIEDDARRYPGKLSYDADGHRVVGYDIDLAHRIASELGVTLKVVRTYPDFNAVCRAVANGEADIAISKLSVTYHRSQYVAYSHPYVTLRMGLLINRLMESQSGRGPDPAGLCNHPNARLGIIAKTSFVEFAKELFPQAQCVEYPDQETLVRAVRKGEVLAAFYEEFEIRKAIRLFPDMSIYCRETYLPGHEDSIAMAVSPASPTLLSFVNLLLAREGLVTTVDAVLGEYLPRGDASAVGVIPAACVFGAEFAALLALFLLFAAAWMVPAFRRRARRNADRRICVEGGAA